MNIKEKIIYGLLFLCAAAMLGYWALGAGLRSEVSRLNANCEVVRAEIKDLTSKRDDLTGRIEALKGNSRAIERRAREDLKMVRPDETLIMLPEKANGQ